MLNRWLVKFLLLSFTVMPVAGFDYFPIPKTATVAHLRWRETPGSYTVDSEQVFSGVVPGKDGWKTILKSPHLIADEAGTLVFSGEILNDSKDTCFYWGIRTGSGCKDGSRQGIWIRIDNDGFSVVRKVDGHETVVRTASAVQKASTVRPFELTLYCHKNSQRIAAYLNGIFLGETEIQIDAGFICELCAKTDLESANYSIKVRDIESDIPIVTRHGKVRKVKTAELGTHAGQNVILLDMDQGKKREWFLRKETEAGAEIRLWKVIGLDPDGIIRHYILDPPALLWKWPVKNGDTWTETPDLIIDGGTPIKTQNTVEILDTNADVLLHSGFYQDVLELKITFESHLGTDTSTIHLEDGIGLLREEQIVNDGRIMLTEYLDSDIITTPPKMTLKTDSLHYSPGDDMIIRVNYSHDQANRKPILTYVWFEYMGDDYFWDGRRSFTDRPTGFLMHRMKTVQIVLPEEPLPCKMIWHAISTSRDTEIPTGGPATLVLTMD